MIFHQLQNNKIAVIEPHESMHDVRSALDMLGNASFNGCTGLLVYKDALPEQFFDLKTRLAGEILQKFSNYHMKIAIVGDFSGLKSKALNDFIRESNKGSQVFFKPTYAEGIAALR